MMSLELFIRQAVHRIAMRWWRWRAIESIGLAVVIGSAVGMILVPIFAWQGEPGWQLCSGVLALSIIIGCIIAFRRRPSEMQTAIEVDRQWRLDELLVTAVEMISLPPLPHVLMGERAGVRGETAGTQPALSPQQRSSPLTPTATLVSSPEYKGEGVDPLMRQTVLQMATLALSQQSLNNLALHRFSRQAWAGIASLPVLLVLLTGICSHPLVLRAAAEVRKSSEPTASIEKSSPIDSQRVDRPISRPVNPDGEEELAPKANETAQAFHARPENSSTNSSDSSGSARGRTNDAELAQARRSSASPDVANKSGAPSGGNGTASTGAASSWHNGRVASSDTRAAPWDRPNWTQQQTRELQSLEQSPPAASYRDLIRDYFSR